jgi:hypothetical protein
MCGSSSTAPSSSSQYMSSVAFRVTGLHHRPANQQHPTCRRTSLPSRSRRTRGPHLRAALVLESSHRLTVPVEPRSWYPPSRPEAISQTTSAQTLRARLTPRHPRALRPNWSLCAFFTAIRAPWPEGARRRGACGSWSGHQPPVLGLRDRGPSARAEFRSWVDAQTCAALVQRDSHRRRLVSSRGRV